MLHFPTVIHVEMFHDFVDGVERWKISWALVDGNPKKHSTCNKP